MSASVLVVRAIVVTGTQALRRLLSIVSTETALSTDRFRMEPSNPQLGDSNALIAQDRSQPNTERGHAGVSQRNRRAWSPYPLPTSTAIAKTELKQLNKETMIKIYFPSNLGGWVNIFSPREKTVLAHDCQEAKNWSDLTSAPTVIQGGNISPGAWWSLLGETLPICPSQLLPWRVKGMSAAVHLDGAQPNQRLPSLQKERGERARRLCARNPRCESGGTQAANKKQRQRVRDTGTRPAFCWVGQKVCSSKTQMRFFTNPILQRGCDSSGFWAWRPGEAEASATRMGTALLSSLSPAHLPPSDRPGVPCSFFIQIPTPSAQPLPPRWLVYCIGRVVALILLQTKVGETCPVKFKFQITNGYFLE